MSDLRATLAVLHDLVAHDLVAKLQSGEAPAAYHAQAIALLKHNNVHVAPGAKNKALDKLRDTLEGLPIPGQAIAELLNAPEKD